MTNGSDCAQPCGIRLSERASGGGGFEPTTEVNPPFSLLSLTEVSIESGVMLWGVTCASMPRTIRGCEGRRVDWFRWRNQQSQCSASWRIQRLNHLDHLGSPSGRHPHRRSQCLRGACSLVCHARSVSPLSRYRSVRGTRTSLNSARANACVVKTSLSEDSHKLQGELHGS